MTLDELLAECRGCVDGKLNGDLRTASRRLAQAVLDTLPTLQAALVEACDIADELLDGCEAEETLNAKRIDELRVMAAVPAELPKRGLFDFNLHRDEKTS